MEMATNGIDQGQNTSSPAVSSAPESNVQSAPSQAEERSFRQSELNDIVKRAKHDAVETYKRTVTQQPEYAAQKYGEIPSTSHNNEDVIRRLAAEEAQRLRDTWVKEAQSKAEADNANRIVQNFWNKIAPGKEKYQDFDKVTSDIEYGAFPNVVQILSEYVDNSHDMLYDLGKDFTKLSLLEDLAQRSPRAAIIQAQRMSQALKDNEAASKIRLPNEPLSQMRPSNTGTDSGALGIRDLRAKYKG
jgi:hypothetical protein